jgi:transcriptional regulator with PAS, ATPase and Fis domain
MDAQQKISNLESEICALQCQLQEQKEANSQYQRAYEQLEEKEAYNFALFQFNPFYIVVVDREGRVTKSNAAKKNSGDRLPDIGDVMYRDYASKHSVNMYEELMHSIHTGVSKTFPEMKYGNKFLAIFISPFPKGAIIVSQDITEVKRIEMQRIQLITELQRALNEIETLRELLPICASCKRIRDDQGYWNEIEQYFKKRSHLDFSHTMCPDCVKKVYPEVWERMERKKAAAV